MRFTLGARALSFVSVTMLALSPMTASAQVTTFRTFLSDLGSGLPSAATGEATVTLDQVANTMRVQLTFSGLVGSTTTSHIHCCTAIANSGNAGVATTTPTFVGFPFGVMSGSYDATYDMTLSGSYNPAFVTAFGGTTAAAFAALTAGMFAEKSYVNIHTSYAPGGEIRGTLQVVPEPSTVALMGIGLAGLLVTASRRRRA